MKNKLNVKRAFKTLEKCSDRTYFYRLTVPSKDVLVSNGHVVLTVSEANFEENKQYLKNLTENTRLRDIIIDFSKENTVVCKPTTVSILYYDKQTRVMKADNGRVGVVNELYLQMLEDVGCDMYFEVSTQGGDTIKTPIGQCVVANGDVYHCNMVLPICCNVRDILENVLGN